MSLPAAKPLPSIVEAEGDRAYLGYRRRGTATLRLPSGVHIAVPSRSGRALAEAVLRDRLGRKPTTALVDRSDREWAGPCAQGEFVWPVVAIDEWLTACVFDGAGTASGTRRHSAPARVRALARHLFSGPHSWFDPTLSPRGGH